MDPYPIMQVGKRTPAIMNGGRQKPLCSFKMGSRNAWAGQARPDRARCKDCADDCRVCIPVLPMPDLTQILSDIPVVSSCPLSLLEVVDAGAVVGVDSILCG